MQAIILGAGRGSRLGKYTEQSSKCMIEVNNKPIIQRVIEILYKNKIKDIVFVCGYQKEKIKKYLVNKFKEINFTFIDNDSYQNTNNIYSFYLARDVLLKDENTLLLEADLVFDEDIIKELIEDKKENVVAISNYRPNMEGTVVTIEEKKEIIEKFCKSTEIERNDVYYKTINIYKFNKKFLKEKYIPLLEEYIRDNKFNEYYEKVLEQLVQEKTNLNYKMFKKEKWYEIDNEEDLKNAKKMFEE